MTTEIQTRSEAIKTASVEAFAKGNEFLNQFETSIQTFGIDELKDIKVNINSGLVSTKRKISKANWDLGNAITPKVHEQLCNFSRVVSETPYTVVESENAKGEIILRHLNNFGLKQVKPNTDEMVLRMLQITGTDAGLMNKYRKASKMLNDSNAAYIDAEDSGTDKALGVAMRARMLAISTMNTIKREITKHNPAVIDGKDFATAMHKGCIASLNERKNAKMARVKIMGAQTSIIQSRINQLDKIGHGKELERVGSQYYFTPAAKQIPDPTDK